MSTGAPINERAHTNTHTHTHTQSHPHRVGAGKKTMKPKTIYNKNSSGTSTSNGNRANEKRTRPHSFASAGQLKEAADSASPLARRTRRPTNGRAANLNTHTHTHRHRGAHTSTHIRRILVSKLGNKKDPLETSETG